MIQSQHNNQFTPWAHSNHQPTINQSIRHQAEQDVFQTGVGVQAHTLGAIITPAFTTIFNPAAASAAAAAGPAKTPLGWELDALRPGFGLPSADTAGEWIVRAMGKSGSPVITPYIGHGLQEAVITDPLMAAVRWSAALRGAVFRKMHAGMAAAFGGGAKGTVVGSASPQKGGGGPSPQKGGGGASGASSANPSPAKTPGSKK